MRAATYFSANAYSTLDLRHVQHEESYTLQAEPSQSLGVSSVNSIHAYSALDVSAVAMLTLLRAGVREAPLQSETPYCLPLFHPAMPVITHFAY